MQQQQQRKIEHVYEGFQMWMDGWNWTLDSKTNEEEEIFTKKIYNLKYFILLARQFWTFVWRILLECDLSAVISNWIVAFDITQIF